MKDNVPKGTGNSRYLKSAISSGTTWEQFRSMIRDGTLPVDLGGINAAGWQVVGDALNKANLLPDSVASALGLTGNPQVKDALNALRTTLSGKAQLVLGSYTGTGTGGKSAPTKITFSFVPRVVLIIGKMLSKYTYNCAALWVSGHTKFFSLYESTTLTENMVVSLSSKTLSWYRDVTGDNQGSYQLNMLNDPYVYLALA